LSSKYFENFLRLLRSQEQENMELALQLAKNNSIFQDELKRLIKVHHAIEYRPRGYPEDLSEELGIDDLIDLNVSFFFLRGKRNHLFAR